MASLPWHTTHGHAPRSDPWVGVTWYHEGCCSRWVVSRAGSDKGLAGARRSPSSVISGPSPQVFIDRPRN